MKAGRFVLHFFVNDTRILTTGYFVMADAVVGDGAASAWPCRA
jgi:hypothetical protein